MKLNNFGKRGVQRVEKRTCKIEQRVLGETSPDPGVLSHCLTVHCLKGGQHKMCVCSKGM